MRRGFAGALVALAATGVLAAPAGGEGRTGGAACPKRFRGTIERSTEGGHDAVELSGRDIRTTLAVDFGNRKNYTIYFGDFRIPKRALGTTIEAPEGKTLVTTFVRAADGDDLHEGQRLRIPRDPSTVIVDHGGGARATTNGASGTVVVRKLSDDRVCFTFDYEDEFQRLDGTVSAPLEPLELTSST